MEGERAAFRAARDAGAEEPWGAEPTLRDRGKA
jgi:hypothetical protein